MYVYIFGGSDNNFYYNKSNCLGSTYIFILPTEQLIISPTLLLYPSSLISVTLDENLNQLL